MPFFSRRHSSSADEPRTESAQPVEQRSKHHSILGIRRDSPSSPTSAAPSAAATNGGNGNDSVRRSSTISKTSQTSEHRPDEAGGRHRNLLQRTFGNGNGSEMSASVIEARDRVTAAEAAEQEADRALEAARQSVRQAHEHARKIELEAEEDARLARIKQHQAREVTKRGKQLGRK